MGSPCIILESLAQPRPSRHMAQVRILRAGHQHHPVVSKRVQATCGNRLDTLEAALLRSLPEIIPQLWGLTSCTSHLAIQDSHARQACNDGQRLVAAVGVGTRDLGMLDSVWLVPLCPLLGAMLNGFFGRR